MEGLLAERYELQVAVGSGGMGTVWRAHDMLLDRTVAVKEVRFSAQLTDDERREQTARAVSEARHAARLEHPRIVPTYDVLIHEGRPWIVMRFIPGQSLEQRVLTGGRLAPAEVERLGRGLLEALAAAHRGGVLHRDVKPSNVLITEDGEPMLTDFSVARAIGQGTATSTGVIIGSPGYIAPERVVTGVAGPEADLFGLGATLFFASEGVAPFAHEDAIVGAFAAAIHPHPRPVHASPALTTLLDGLLEKDPRARMTIAAAADLLNMPIPTTAATDPTSPPPPAAFTSPPPAAPLASAPPGAPFGPAQPQAASLTPTPPPAAGLISAPPPAAGPISAPPPAAGPISAPPPAAGVAPTQSPAVGFTPTPVPTAPFGPGSTSAPLSVTPRVAQGDAATPVWAQGQPEVFAAGRAGIPLAVAVPEEAAEETGAVKGWISRGRLALVAAAVMVMVGGAAVLAQVTNVPPKNAAPQAGAASPQPSASLEPSAAASSPSATATPSARAASPKPTPPRTTAPASSPFYSPELKVFGAGWQPGWNCSSHRADPARALDASSCGLSPAPVPGVTKAASKRVDVSLEQFAPGTADDHMGCTPTHPIPGMVSKVDRPGTSGNRAGFYCETTGTFTENDNTIGACTYIMWTSGDNSLLGMLYHCFKFSDEGAAFRPTIAILDYLRSLWNARA